jgi:hypothetical protein
MGFNGIQRLINASVNLGITAQRLVKILFLYEHSLFLFLECDYVKLVCLLLSLFKLMRCVGSFLLSYSSMSLLIRGLDLYVRIFFS